MQKIEYTDYELDPEFKVWRQKELIVTTDYGDHYLHKQYKDTPEFLIKASELSALRVGFIEQFIPEQSSLVDIGCGLGSFVRVAKFVYDAHGYDPFTYSRSMIVPVDRIHVLGKDWDVMTFFDTLEHFPNIREARVLMNCSKFIVVCVPECHFPNNRHWFMNWKHRRPGEHLWHFNRESLVNFMRYCGFKLITFSNFEDKIRGPLNSYLPNILTGLFERY
jgi:hypothetical protein